MLSVGSDLRMKLQMRYGGAACYCVQKKKISFVPKAAGRGGNISQRKCHSMGALKIIAVPEEGGKTGKEEVANGNRKRCLSFLHLGWR